MRIYQISTTGKPSKGRFRDWADLEVQQKDARSGKLNYDIFNGCPYPTKWKPVELYVPKPLLPRPDFYSFGLGKFVCNERAAEIAGEPLEMAGELLPVAVQGEKGKFYIFNCTNCLNVVNQKKSIWRSAGVNGRLKILDRPGFIGERFGDESLFKIPEDGGMNIYCLERTADPDGGEFKALVEHYRLTGLEFKLVWLDEKRRPAKRRKKYKS